MFGEQPLIFWIGFNVFILLMLALDLGVFHRKAHSVTFKEAVTWSIVWVTLALIFFAGVYNYIGEEKGIEFITGYLIEYSLSMDNIFVFVLIFTYFHVPRELQHRVLFWGILGALVMRGILIIIGTALIVKFAWIMYLFGAFLIFTGFKMAVSKMEGIHPEENPVVRLFEKFFPVTKNFEGKKFFTVRNNKLYMTPLFLVLIMIETTDLVFALDSIPAIFAISTDPFIVYTSNVFAILGLRSMYFMLAGIVHKFRYLKVGLGVLLVYVGIKMVTADLYHVPTAFSLVVIATCIGLSVIASLVIEEKKEPLPKPKKKKAKK